MPPRHAYWTILIGDSPTAFRARDREELLPTFERLRAKQPDAVLKWFERGRLWASPEEARGPAPAFGGPPERRGKDWRPGGAHRDPRDRFKKDKPGARGHGDRGGPGPTDRPRDERTGDDRGAGAPGRPWQPRPDPRAARPPAAGRADRPWRPKSERPGGDKAWRPKPAGGGHSDRPWRPKPSGDSRRPALAPEADGLGRPASVEAEAAVRCWRARTGPGWQASVATKIGSPRSTVLDAEARRR